MTLTRTTQRWARVYINGYDMSGYSRSLGTLDWTFDEANLTALSDAAKGYLPYLCEMTPTMLNGNFDNTATSGLHVIANSPGVSRVVSIPFGMNAEPAQGDYVYCGRYQQAGYQANEDGGAVTVSIPWAGWDAANQIGYETPWGRMLKAKGNVTAANTAIGNDDLAATLLGGYMVYHVFSGDGTATIKVQKSTTTNLDGSFSDLSGATTGSIDCSSPTSGIIALSKTATIGQYLRWQIALGTAVNVNFSLAFVRGIH